MNKDETLALYAKGKDAWNAWAKEMLDKRAEMQAAGTWAESDNEATRAWLDEARADFACHAFESETHFGGFLFPGDAVFSRATFSGDAQFGHATFRGGTSFRNATFSGDAWFFEARFDRNVSFLCAAFRRNVHFEGAAFSEEANFQGAGFSESAHFAGAVFTGDAWFARTKFNEYTSFKDVKFTGEAHFGGATFSLYASFACATFSGNTWFSQAAFKGFTSFAGATFQKGATFTAAHGDRAFTLEGARFNEVPDFIQAHFEEAPRLDNLRIPEVRGLWNRCSRKVKIDDHTSARYRALKRLAIQAHDHTRELDYFASELKASRGVVLSIARFWYELFSNFGRCIALPLVWWGLGAIGFAWVYLCKHFAQAAEAGRGYAMSSGAWLWSWIVSTFGNTPAPRLVCLVGQDTSPLRAASGLSIRKALPFAGVASANKLDQIYACLYGIHGESRTGRDLPERFTPVIPDAVDYVGIGQLLLSLVLISLFLLAVRNHFRIR